MLPHTIIISDPKPSIHCTAPRASARGMTRVWRCFRSGRHPGSLRKPSAHLQISNLHTTVFNIMAQAGIDFAPRRPATILAMNTAHHQPQREWLTAAEAVAITGRSGRTLLRWAARDAWRTHLGMLINGPTRFYHRADVLASLRSTSAQVAGGAKVGATASGAEGVRLPAMGQRLELTQARRERLSPGLAEHLDALHRHAAALEAHAEHLAWWDRVGTFVAAAAQIWRH